MGKISETVILDTLIFFFKNEGTFFRILKKQIKQRKQKLKMNNMEIIKSFMQGHFHSLESLCDVCKLLV